MKRIIDDIKLYVAKDIRQLKCTMNLEGYVKLDQLVKRLIVDSYERGVKDGNAEKTKEIEGIKEQLKGLLPKEKINTHINSKDVYKSGHYQGD